MKHNMAGNSVIYDGRILNMGMDENVERILREIKRNLKERYGDGIKKVILYGSYARGEATEESDIDVLVVVSDDLDPREVRRSLEPLIGDFYVKDLEIVTIFPVRESDFEHKQSDFLINVRKEGIAV